ncbi:MAG: preprotein translocase subunit SecE [Clostridia bacterium]|nr:preprotein translocase subunit SecE [Clostridia bacterium]
MAKKKAPEKKPNVFVRMGKGIAKFFRDTKSEIKKIVWPTPKTTFRNMGLVLLAMLIVGAVIFGLDFGLQKLFGLVMNVAGN